MDEMKPGWQPIETAPKDGRGVVVYSPKSRSGQRRRSRELASVAYYARGWLSSPGDARLAPTHWMPLPSPPVQQ